MLHQAPGLPYAGDWHGPEGIERFMAVMAVMAEFWRSVEFLDQERIVDGQTVVVTSRVRFVARASGCALETLLVQVMTVRDGGIRDIRPFCWDPAAVRGVPAAVTTGPDASS